MLAGALGFGIAGGILSLFPRSTNVLFIADAARFVLAAVIILGIPTLGGGSIGTPVSGGFRRSWAVVAARRNWVIGTLGHFLFPISNPAFFALPSQVANKVSFQC